MQARTERLKLAVAVVDAEIAAMRHPLAANAPKPLPQHLLSRELTVEAAPSVRREPGPNVRLKLPHNPSATLDTPMDAPSLAAPAPAAIKLLEHTATSAAAGLAAAAAPTVTTCAAPTAAHVELDRSQQGVPAPEASVRSSSDRADAGGLGGELVGGSGKPGVGTLGGDMQRDMEAVRAFLALLSPPGPQVRLSTRNHCVFFYLPLCCC